MGLDRSPDLQVSQDAQAQTGLSSGLSLEQFSEWHEECRKQPTWRAIADKEADYLDANQLDSDLIRKQQAIGMPPAIDPLMGPELNELCGLEERLRKNWKVSAENSGTENSDMAEALGEKLKEAETHSKADAACSEGFRALAGVGAGFICVDKQSDPFKYPYRTTVLNRNDCWWDWKGTQDPDMHDHRFFIRRRWTDSEQASLFFPDNKELIKNAAKGWKDFDKFTNDGGSSTGLQTGQIAWGGGGAVVGAPTLLQGVTPGTYALLYSAYTAEQSRASSIEEQEWRDEENKRVCLYECWYRRWTSEVVFMMPNGRVVTYDETNQMHVAAVASGRVTVKQAVVSRVYVSIWLGPHKLIDRESPYAHNRFPYVPFWGFREDRTGVPFGLARGWMYHQDTVNSVSAKLRWGISATRTIRTKGAYIGTDDQFRRESARLDADILLDPDKMKNGGMMEITRDFKLTEEQANLLRDSRNAIRRTGMGIDDDDEKNNPLPELEVIPNQHGRLFKSFNASRNEVGYLLLSMIIEDMKGVETQVTLKGDVLSPSKVITLNKMGEHPTFGGMTILDNDVSSVLLRVVLEDVPSTPSYRGQQSQSFAEVIKSAPEKYQSVLFPFMLQLLDVPSKEKVVAAIRDSNQQQTPEEARAQIKSDVDKIYKEAVVELKKRELTIKESEAEAKRLKLEADTVLQKVTAMYEAMQAGGVVIQSPGIAPVGDAILKGAGFQSGQGGENPGIEQVGTAAPAPIPAAQPGHPLNLPSPAGTHPNFPNKPVSPALGAENGIETPAI